MKYFTILGYAIVLWSVASHCNAQNTPVMAEVSQLQVQLDSQAAQIAALQQKLTAQDQALSGTIQLKGSNDCLPKEVQRVPLVMERPLEVACDLPVASAKPHKLDYYSDYDKGFVIRPFDPEQNPFELNVNGWIQFRYHGFARDVDSWTDNAGVTRPVKNRTAFDIERARLVFSGYAVDQRLTYFLHLDGDTDGGDTVDFFDYWWAWKFSDLLEVQLGKRKVPGSRQWLLGARRTRFVDRPMANDFYRPTELSVFSRSESSENMLTTKQCLATDTELRTFRIPRQTIS